MSCKLTYQGKRYNSEQELQKVIDSTIQPVDSPLMAHLTKKFNSPGKAYQYHSLLNTPIYQNWATANKQSLTPSNKVFDRFIKEAIEDHENKRNAILKAEAASIGEANDIPSHLQPRDEDTKDLGDWLNKGVESETINSSDPVLNELMQNKKMTIARLRKRMGVLKENIDRSSNINKRRQWREKMSVFGQEVAALTGELNELDRSNNLYLIADMMNRELTWVDDLLHSNLNSDLTESAKNSVEAENLLHAWSGIIDLLNETQEHNIEIVDKLFNKNKIERLLKEIREIQVGIVEQQAMERSGLSIEDKAIKEIWNPIKDTSEAAGLLRGIGQSQHILLQQIYGRTAEANRAAHQEMQDIFTGNFNTIMEAAEAKLQELGLDWDVFFAKDEKGRMKDKIVGPLSDKYINTEYFKNPYKTKNKKKGAENTYNAWYLNNHIMIDPIRVAEDRENYKAELLKKIPSSHAIEMAFEETLKRYRKYKLFREEQEIILNEKFQDPAAIENILNAWDRANNPMLVANDKKGHIKLKNNEVRYKKLTFSYGLPIENRGGVKTNYYDANFTELENHKELLDFQREFVNIMHQLNVYLPGELNRNFTIPLFQEAVLGAWKGSDVAATGRAYMDNIINTLRGDNLADDIYIENKKGRKQLATNFYSSTDNKILKQYKLEVEKFMLEKGKKPNIKEKKALRNIAVDKIVQTSSQHLGKNLTMFAAMVVGYKHKATVETEVLLIDKLFKEKVKKARVSKSGEILYRNKNNELVSEPPFEGAVPEAMNEGENELTNELIRLNSTIDNFLGVPKPKGESIGINSVPIPSWIPVIGGDVLRYTEEDKRQIRELEDVLDELEIKEDKVKTALMNKEISKEEADFKIEALEKKREALNNEIDTVGSNWTWGGIINALMQWVQLKALGWNLSSSFANLAFGLLTNNVEAAGEQYYTEKNLNKGYALIRHSFTKTFSDAIGMEAGDTGVKIRTLMDELNVLKKPSEEFFEIKGERSGMKKFYNPFVFTDMTEYLNQGPVMIAVLDNLKITTQSGEEIAIWDAFDERGEWRQEVGDKASYMSSITNAANVIDKAIKNNHGDYDNQSSPLAIKRKNLKVITQFRTWMFEGFFNRTEIERKDYELGITKKGRWRTYSDQGLKNSLGALTNIALNNDISGGELSEIDQINMRKNLREIRNYAIVMGTYLLLTALSHALKGGEDDEEEVAENSEIWGLPTTAPGMGMISFLLNLTSRVENDILLYINPAEFRKIAGKDLIPILTIVDDIGRVNHAFIMWLQGKDELKTGPYKGRSRLGRDLMKATPGAASIYKMINNTTQILSKQKGILEEAIFNDDEENRDL